MELLDRLGPPLEFLPKELEQKELQARCVVVPFSGFGGFFEWWGRR